MISYSIIEPFSVSFLTIILFFKVTVILNIIIFLVNVGQLKHSSSSLSNATVEIYL